MPIFHGHEKKLNPSLFEENLVKYFKKIDENSTYISKPEFEKWKFLPDLFLNYKDKDFIVEFKGHAPFLSDISMLAGVTGFYIEEFNRDCYSLIIFPFEDVPEDVNEFAEENNVRLLSIKNINELPEKMDSLIK